MVEDRDMLCSRAILWKGLLFQEEKLLLQDTEKKHYPISELSKDMAGALINQWLKANISFSPPVVITKLGVQKKLQTAWETLQKRVGK